MRPISRSRLKRFWESRRADAKFAEQVLSAWFKITKKAEWKDFGALKQTFGSADQVGNCVVFDIGNNRYRLIGRVNYDAGKVFILAVMDHEEYDKQSWIKNCRCHEPPPKRIAAMKQSPQKGMPASRPRKDR